MYEQEVDSHLTWVMEDDDEIIGFACGWRVLDEFQLTNIGVAPQRQRQGRRARCCATCCTSMRSGCSTCSWKYARVTCRKATIRVVRVPADCRAQAILPQTVEDALVMSLVMKTEDCELRCMTFGYRRRIAGLTYALETSKLGSVAILTKGTPQRLRHRLRPGRHCCRAGRPRQL
jgi:hypothetical protein